MAHPGGRPPKFNSPEELEKKWLEYVEYEKEYFSFSGFAVFCDTHRGYFSELEQDKPEYSCTIKRIRDEIALFTIKHGQKTEKNQALNIFLLKNYGYTDKTEQDITVKGSISIEKLFLEAEDEEDTQDNG